MVYIQLMYWHVRRIGVASDDLDEDKDGSLKRQKGLMAVVEDRIQMSMLQGEFDNLKNKGKPLERVGGMYD